MRWKFTLTDYLEWASFEFSDGTVYLDVPSSTKMDHAKTAITSNVPQVPELLPDSA